MLFLKRTPHLCALMLGMLWLSGANHEPTLRCIVAAQPCNIPALRRAKAPTKSKQPALFCWAGAAAVWRGE